MEIIFMWSLWKMFFIHFGKSGCYKNSQECEKIPKIASPQTSVGGVQCYLFHCLSHNSLSFSFVISFHPVLEIIKDFGVFVVAHVLTHSIITGLGAPMQHFWRRGT